MEITKQRIEKDQGFKEKREFLRIDINAPVTFHSENGDWQEAKGMNLSAQGILIQAAVRLSVGDNVTVHMRPHNQAQSLLEAEGTVLRCSEIIDNMYQIGIHFKSVK